MKIVGVYAGETVPARYDKLRQAAEQHTYFEDISIQSSWQNMRDIGLYTYVLMHDSFAEVYRSQSSQQPEQASPSAYFLPYEHHVSCGGDYGLLYYINTYTEEHGLPLLELYSLADTQKVAALGQGEIALSLQKYAEVLGRALDYAVSDKYESAMQAVARKRSRRRPPATKNTTRTAAFGRFWMTFPAAIRKREKPAKTVCPYCARSPWKRSRRILRKLRHSCRNIRWKRPHSPFRQITVRPH